MPVFRYPCYKSRVVRFFINKDSTSILPFVYDIILDNETNPMHIEGTIYIYSFLNDRNNNIIECWNVCLEVWTGMMLQVEKRENSLFHGIFCIFSFFLYIFFITRDNFISKCHIKKQSVNRKRNTIHVDKCFLFCLIIIQMENISPNSMYVCSLQNFLDVKLSTLYYFLS